MPVVFSVTVSGDPACRVLAADVARRYFELAGAEPAQVAVFGTAVATAVDTVAQGEQVVDLAFSREGSEVDVDVSCAGRHELCRFSFSTS